MKNHPHLAIEIRNGISISKIMQAINLSYSIYFRKRYNYIGHVWQGRFKSNPIGKDSYLLKCLRYIDQNPVRKGLVRDPADYKWGSYRYYAFGEKNPLLDINGGKKKEDVEKFSVFYSREENNFIIDKI